MENKYYFCDIVFDMITERFLNKEGPDFIIGNQILEYLDDQFGWTENELKFFNIYHNDSELILNRLGSLEGSFTGKSAEQIDEIFNDTTEKNRKSGFLVVLGVLLVVSFLVRRCPDSNKSKYEVTPEMMEMINQKIHEKRYKDSSINPLSPVLDTSQKNRAYDVIDEIIKNKGKNLKWVIKFKGRIFINFKNG